MSEPGNNHNERQNWLKGRAAKTGDEFARRAERGRQELNSEREAADMLSDLDALIDGAYAGKATKEQEATIHSLPKHSRARWWSAAAAILVLVIAGWWWANQRTSPEALYADSFEHFSNDLVVRTMGSDDTDQDLNLAEALAAYAAKDYQQAVTDLEKYRQQTDANPKTAFYLGISYLETGDTEAAIREFQASKVLAYQANAADWYTALAYLKKGDTAIAKATLELVAKNENSLFQGRAVKLLERL